MREEGKRRAAHVEEETVLSDVATVPSCSSSTEGMRWNISAWWGRYELKERRERSSPVVDDGLDERILRSGPTKRIDRRSGESDVLEDVVVPRGRVHDLVRLYLGVVEVDDGEGGSSCRREGIRSSDDCSRS